MAKRITFGLLIIAFGLLYNIYRTDSEQQKEVKKEKIINHSYYGEIIWIDDKLFDIIEYDSIFVIENAPIGNYKFADIEFSITENSTNLIFKNINR